MSMTARDQQNLSRYLKEIGEVDLLTTEEEKDLARRAQDGDDAALNHLVRANLRFVVTVAKKYQNAGLPLEDLINEGNYGLIKAAQRFDVERGFKFISYAVWWVRQAILQALADHGRTVRLPQNQIGTITKINGAIEELTQNLGRQPTVEEIAEFTDIDESKVEDSYENRNRSSSMDRPFGLDGDGENGTLLDVLEDDEAVLPDMNALATAQTKEIELVLALLTDREADIVRRYYGLVGEGQTLEEIGNVYDISCERVRQLKVRALNKMREAGAALVG